MGEVLRGTNDEHPMDFIGPRLTSVGDRGVSVFDDAFREINIIGQRFWGLDTGYPTVPLPQTPQYKAGLLRRVLRTVPDLSKQLDTWSSKTNDISYKGADKYEQHPIEFGSEVHEIIPKTPSNALEAWRIPAIREIVYTTAAHEGNPVITIAECVEGLLNKPGYRSVSDRSRRFGSRAIELFVFSASKSAVAKRTELLSLEYYRDEAIRIREIEATYAARNSTTDV